MFYGLKRVTGGLLATAALFTSVVSIVQAGADADLLKKGETVFNTVAGIGCKGCHGDFAEGDLGVGPFIRGASDGSVRAAIEGIGAMVAVKASIKEDEIAAVSAYVNSLGSMQVVRTMAKRGRFLPAELSVHPGTSVQVVVQNASIKPHTFKSDNMGTEEVAVAARKAGAVTWQAPQEEGTYTLYCTDCKLKDQYFTINVSKAAKPFNAIAKDFLSSSQM